MAVIKPFKCIRPEASVAEKVAALPYDVYDRTREGRSCLITMQGTRFIAFERIEGE